MSELMTKVRSYLREGRGLKSGRLSSFFGTGIYVSEREVVLIVGDDCVCVCPCVRF